MMKKKKSLLLLLSVSLFMVGCVGGDACSLKWNEQNDTYVFDRFEFFLDEGDGERIFEHELPEMSVVNRTNTYQKAVFPAPDDLIETAEFSCENPVFPNLAEEIGEIKLPISVKDDKIKIGLYGMIFGFNSSFSFPYIPSSETIETVDMPPYTEATHTVTVRYREVIVSYRARFVGQNTGNVVDVIGKWKGVYVDYLASKVIISDIKN